MTEAEIEKELEDIDKKLVNAFIEHLSVEEYCNLLDRKLKLIHKYYFEEKQL